jgi:hypothetical protein
MILVFLAALVLILVRDSHGNVTDGTIAVLLVGAMISVLTGFLADIMARTRR